MAPNLPTTISTTDDVLDLEAFINDLEVVEEESGCQVAGAGTTDTSSRYNAQQKKLVQSYVDFLGKCRLSIAIGFSEERTYLVTGLCNPPNNSGKLRSIR
jgi:hypothetical protein